MTSPKKSTSYLDKFKIDLIKTIQNTYKNDTKLIDELINIIQKQEVGYNTPITQNKPTELDLNTLEDVSNI